LLALEHPIGVRSESISLGQCPPAAERGVLGLDVLDAPGSRAGRRVLGADGPVLALQGEYLLLRLRCSRWSTGSAYAARASAWANVRGLGGGRQAAAVAGDTSS
jgi:hypothetical protein